ncbi:hypothetical protein BVX97_05835 [bacterium E08(2017)]|nr:hypothetical protein BVX97_05835 [bacterium E08(2017)]
MQLSLKNRIRINRAEISGSFGDIGTDLPLLVGMILASGLHAPSVLIVFGFAQIASALFYGIPMPVQPLKAVAALVIAGGISASEIYGAGVSVGLIMLLLTVSGLLESLRKAIPKSVIRGMQLGLGLKLAMLSVLAYVPSDGVRGLMLACACVLLVLLLGKSQKCPAALPVIVIGLVYALSFNVGIDTFRDSFGVAIPRVAGFTKADMLQGLIVLALPQIPLSLGNSLLATHQMASDLFPERKLKIRTIGYTYSFFNIVCPLFGGVPVCHGSGGMAGHYVFGGRTGGSVLIYGCLLLVFGCLWGNGFESVVRIFPLPVLGVILITEGVTLMRFTRDVVSDRPQLLVALVTALCAIALPYGFLVGLIVGTVLAYLSRAIFVSGHRSESVCSMEATNA